MQATKVSDFHFLRHCIFLAVLPVMLNQGASVLGVYDFEECMYCIRIIHFILSGLFAYFKQVCCALQNLV